MALTTDLISWWELGEASGTRFDSTATGNDLTDNNTVTSTTGKVGDAAQFTAVNLESLSHVSNASLYVGSDSVPEWTFCAWVYLDSTSSYMLVASKSGSVITPCWDLYYDIGTGGFTFYLSSDGVNYSNAVQVGSSLSAGTWYFVLIWVDIPNNAMYIQLNNGIPAQTAPIFVIVDGGGGFRIGARYDTPTLFWDGRIDQAGFWKRVLTDPERTELYNSGAGMSYADVVGGGVDFLYPKICVSY